MNEIISLKNQLKQNEEKITILETKNDKLNLEVQKLKDQFQEVLSFNEKSKYVFSLVIFY